MLTLSDDKIREIASEVECGMVCYIDRDTGEFFTIPQGIEDFGDTEGWEDLLTEAQDNSEKYLVIEPPDSRESLRIIEKFIYSLHEKDHVRYRLTQALNKTNPFRHFKHEIDHSGDYREKWFAFRTKEIQKYTQILVRLGVEGIIEEEDEILSPDQQNTGLDKSIQGPTPFAQTYFHGSKADLNVGDLIETGNNSNYGQRKNAKYIFLTATLDAAIWGAELAAGDGRERIYLVEPTGPIEDDPDLTDRKFPGNPTKSFRSQHPFRVVGEVFNWHGHLPEQVKKMKENLDRLKQQGIDSLNN